jgi:FkbH-like protein
VSPRLVKCVVWDLDGTLWEGVLAEGDTPVAKPGAAELVRALDARGVLQSIASRNDVDALEALERLGLRAFFLHPQLGPAAKSAGVARIAELLDVAMESLVFLDDEPFERAEVAATHPEVLCLDGAEAADLLARADVEVPPGTGLDRRRLHLSELERRAAEAEAGGPSERFLEGLAMRLTLRRAAPGDLDRIEELARRTHRMNTTGRLFSREELGAACASDTDLAVIVNLTDRFGDYGSIGFALVSLSDGWTLRALMISCRVQDRGVGSVVLSCLQRGAQRRAAPFRVEYAPSPSNRRMYVTLKLAGFREVSRAAGAVLLEADPHLVTPLPGWLAAADETGLLLP